MKVKKPYDYFIWLKKYYIYNLQLFYINKAY